MAVVKNIMMNQLVKPNLRRLFLRNFLDQSSFLRTNTKILTVPFTSSSYDRMYAKGDMKKKETETEKEKEKYTHFDNLNRSKDPSFAQEMQSVEGKKMNNKEGTKEKKSEKQKKTLRESEETETFSTKENNEQASKEEEINYENYNKIDLIQEIKKTKKDINEKILDNKILKEKYLSVLAENENLRSRYLKEIENNKIYCITNFAKSLLDVADNLSLAIQNINEESLKKNEEISNIHKGIQMTETILHNIFNNYGINKYNPINEKFNPLFHEAIYEIHDDTKEKGVVATVIQHGYKINDRILRAAKVGVVKN